MENNEPIGRKGYYDRRHWLRHVDGHRRSYPHLERSRPPECLPPQHPMGLSRRGDRTLLGQRGSARRSRVRDGVYRISPVENDPASGIPRWYSGTPVFRGQFTNLQSMLFWEDGMMQEQDGVWRNYSARGAQGDRSLVQLKTEKPLLLSELALHLFPLGLPGLLCMPLLTG